MAYDHKIDTWCYWMLLILAFFSNLSTGVSSVAVAIVALLILYSGIKLKKWPEFDPEILRIFGVYFFLQIVIAALSLNPSVSLRSVAGEIHRCFPLFFAMYFIKREHQVKGILLAFMFASIVSAICGFYQYFIMGVPRVYAFSHTPTFYASLLLMQFPVLWLTSTLDFMPKWSRIAAFVMGAVAVLMLILTGTRGAWLAFLVELAFIACFYKRWRVLAAKGVLVLLALMAVLFSTVPVLQARIETMANPNFQSNSERLLMWKSASEIVADYPIHGIGQDVFGFEYNTKYIAPEAKERSEPGKPETGHTHPHNNLLKVTSEGGILGFCSFLLLHGYFFRRFWKLQRQEQKYMMISYGMTAVLVALGLQLEGITDTNMNQVPIMREYWLLVGMLLIAGRVTGYKQHHGN